MLPSKSRNPFLGIWYEKDGARLLSSPCFPEANKEKVLRASVRPPTTSFYSEKQLLHITREFCCESPARFLIKVASDYPFLLQIGCPVVVLLHTVLLSCTLLPEQTQFAILGPPSNPKLFPQPSRACSTLSLRLLCLPRPKNSLCRRLAALHLPLGWMISSCHLP